MRRRRLLLALVAVGLPVGAMAAIGVLSIVHPPRVSFIFAGTSHANQTATPTSSPTLAPSAVPSTSPSAAPIIVMDPNGPRAVPATSLGNGVHGNALLVAPDKNAHSQTWYWDGTSWRLAPTPPARFPNSGPVFDPELGKSILLTDGAMGDALQTWAWNGSSWSDLHLSPPATTGPATLGFDSGTKQLIMSVGSTWVFDTTGWRQIGSANSPEARFQAAMAYDPQLHQLILFGGRPYRSGPNALTDTWTWDGSSWTLRHPATSPQGGADRMVYDPDTKQLVLLEYHFPLNLNKPVEVSMWTWDGAEWHQLHPATLPESGPYPFLAYDSANHQLLLFEGVTNSHDGACQTWIYEGGTWKQVA